MKQIPIYQVDAFASELFTGNPASVCFLSEWPSDELLGSIASENNLPVTAFLICDADNQYAIRWFTPDYELDLCGHGSLAAAFIIFNILEPTWKKIIFNSKSGPVPIRRDGEDIELNFPVKEIEPFEPSEILKEGLGIAPKEVYQHEKERIIAVFEREDDVKNMRPDMRILSKLEHLGIIVTAPALNEDFVSRTFYLRKKSPEDPVTGVSHCIIAPYWSRRLKKSHLNAYQASSRGGYLRCEVRSDRVYIYGKAKLYLQGTILV